MAIVITERVAKFVQANLRDDANPVLRDLAYNVQNNPHNFMHDVNAILDAHDSIEEEYADNFRYARIFCPDEMHAYVQQQLNGCCGSHDEVINGYILFGYNYGH